MVVIKLVVRLGSDIPEHLVYRSNEIIVSKAAYEIGVSPKLIHSEQGVLVLEFIESTTLDHNLFGLKRYQSINYRSRKNVWV